ncbi:dihydroneopterin aldolase [Bermanella marisrubri]|uniref:7,8-dihydroneopterin aldolase n=1 Tax=Bermanella marisrubri TaxID=207949 RepID=Q1N3T3_9GAMM|nr:dihydroneopterin aldolase [Bermanella marisrubri]EAT12791.1 Dihydroneopterin aldolase family protein [Oceanobacter sp. RED65] [Bermanella marisrubri]QIZ83115.1 dihydroneopterin aldolase [Bermanella marisrubri]
MDKVFINQLTIETIIGIYDWEREIKQRVVLDLEMAWDNKPAAQSENIELALNYKAVCDRLQDFIGNNGFLLVETMAEAVAQLLMHEFNVGWLRLKVTKPDAIPQAHGVGVEIERNEKDKLAADAYLNTYTAKPEVLAAKK